MGLNGLLALGLGSVSCSSKSSMVSWFWGSKRKCFLNVVKVLKVIAASGSVLVKLVVRRKV